jgi:hypothetical protein
MLTLMTGLALLAAAQAPDTTVAVNRGQRLEVAVHGGSVHVQAWNRDAVRARTGDAGVRLEVSAGRSRVAVEAGGEYGEPVTADVTLSVPAWMPVTVNGVYLDCTVSGTAADVAAETVQGDVRVEGGRGVVTVTSVQGAVQLSGARGRIQVGSVNDDVTVSDVEGDLAVSTVNGDLQLTGIRSDNVTASTVSGDIAFAGPIAGGGRYGFSTHNGDLTVTLAENTSAVVHVSTHMGDFESAFPVTLSGGGSRRFSFTLGSGAARIELESFNGDIRLVRPGAARTGR